MRIQVRWPAPPGSLYSESATEGFVGARCYVPDGEDRREIGYIVDAKRYNRGSVVVLDLELHNERDLLIAQMRAFTPGSSLIP